MASCERCKKKLSFFERLDPYCSECYKIVGEKALEESATILEDMERQQPVEISVDADAEFVACVLLTTEGQIDLKIRRRINVVTAECAFGMNALKDLFAGVRNIIGGRSEAIQKTMRDARDTVLFELRREAYRVGGNAVVGVSLNYVDLSGAGTMVMLVASGTAVVLEDVP